MNSNIIECIQKWYFEQGDDYWWYGNGIKIETLDNPGWSISIDVVGTDIENKIFQPIKLERGETDWVHCWIEDGKFNAACGPFGLSEVFQIFLEHVGWVNSK